MGSYVLEEAIGTGGMGEVWRARHRLLARPAAVKLVRADVLGKSGEAEMERALTRFRREAEVTSNLQSPHTVELYDYGVSESGSFYYVMELLDGLDLQTLVEEYGPVPPERAVHILVQACASLAEAHALGLVHRDIKPANLVVCVERARSPDFVRSSTSVSWRSTLLNLRTSLRKTWPRGPRRSWRLKSREVVAM